MRGREPGGRLRDPAHGRFRSFCRIAGPILLVGGFIMVAVGVYGFSSQVSEPTTFPDPRSFGNFGKPEKREPAGPGPFWLAFVGMMVLGGGITLTRIGYLGAAARYVAGETAPVATDTFNYVARGAQEGVKEIVAAVAEGVRRDAAPRTVVRCHTCDAENDADAKFCKGCGAALRKGVPCAACNELNDPDANFCDNCGAKLG